MNFRSSCLLTTIMNMMIVRWLLFWWLFDDCYFDDCLMIVIFSSRKTCCQLDRRLLAGLVSARLPTTMSMWTLLHCFYDLYLTLYSPFRFIYITTRLPDINVNFLHHHTRYNLQYLCFFCKLDITVFSFARAMAMRKSNVFLSLSRLCEGAAFCFFAHGCLILCVKVPHSQKLEHVHDSNHKSYQCLCVC